MNAFREQLFRALYAEDDKRSATGTVKVLGLLIAFSIVLAIIATEPVVRSSQGGLLVNLDIAVAVIFLIEYLARMWVALEEGREERDSWCLRLRDDASGDP